jgi:hypothetical protein
MTGDGDGWLRKVVKTSPIIIIIHPSPPNDSLSYTLHADNTKRLGDGTVRWRRYIDDSGCRV